MQGNYILIGEIEPQRLDLIGTSSLSIGHGVEMTGAYSCDASRVPQGISRRTRNAPKTASLTLAFSPTLCAESGARMFDYLSKLEAVVGQKIRLFWAGIELGGFVVKSAQFSGVPDPHDILAAASVGLSLTEDVVGNPQPASGVEATSDVRTLFGA